MFNDPRHRVIYETVLRLISVSRTHTLQIKQEVTQVEKVLVASEMVVGVWKGETVCEIL